MSESKCETRILRDDPENVDAFGNGNTPGPHHRVAQALVELLQSTDGGKIVGLEGAWGTGKSTVVQIFRTLFTAENPHANRHVIQFDAWAHEGDPLRRVFLESLIKELIGKNWVRRKRWTKKLAEIANRRRIVTTRTTPRITLLGRAVALSFLAVPMGTAIVTGLLQSGDVTLSIPGRPHWFFIIGLLLTLSPALVLALNGVRLWFCGDERAPSDPAPWAFVQGRSIEETKTETIETPNPTSLEFENYFNHLMEEALGSAPERRLVVVLDNLDRVDPKDALEIWSTLQTFLQHTIRRENEWFTRLWILVPYDPNGIRKLWAGRGDVPTGRAQVDDLRNVDGTISPASMPLDHEVAQSFLDKSLLLRFSVPPLVQSGWRTHLLKLLRYAFPGHPERECHEICTVFDLFRPNPADPPSPRSLKLFVNQIGTVHRQWGDEFPLTHVAYFVLTCHDRASFVKSLTSGQLPHRDALTLLSKSLRMSLAGLAFNLPPQFGQEVLLAEPIYQALVNVKPDHLVELEEIHGSGFWVVLEHVAHQRLLHIPVQLLMNAVLTLQQSTLMTEQYVAQSPQALYARDIIRRALCAAALELDIEQWRRFVESVPAGAVALLSMGDTDFAKTLTERIVEAFHTEPKDGYFPRPSELADGWITIIEGVEAQGLSEAFPEIIQLPIDTNRWVEFAACLSEKDPLGRFWNRFAPQVGRQAVVEKIHERISGGQFDKSAYCALQVARRQEPERNWSGVINAMRDRLDSARGSAAGECAWLLSALCDLQRQGVREADDTLRLLAEQGHLLHYFATLNGEEGEHYRATCTFTYLRLYPAANHAGSAGNAPRGRKLLLAQLDSENESFANRLVEISAAHKDAVWLLASLRQRHSPLIALCLKKILQRPDRWNILSAHGLVEYWRDIKALLPEGSSAAFAHFISEAVDHVDVCAHVRERKHFSREDAELYSALVDSVGDGVEDFVKWCSEGILRLSKEDWRADFFEDQMCTRLLRSLEQRGAKLQLPIQFVDAIVAAAEAVAEGSTTIRSGVIDWEALAGFVDAKLREVVRRKLLKVTAERGSGVSEDFLETFGRLLVTGKTARSNEDVVAELFVPWLEQGASYHAVRWMRDVLTSIPSFWNSVKDTPSGIEFLHRLRDRLSASTEGEERAVLEEIDKMIDAESTQA